MKSSTSPTSACRRCRYYMPEGRRGGYCQQLDVTVQGAWAACTLALPPFTPIWENFEDIMAWQQKTLVAMQESEVVAHQETAHSCSADTCPADNSVLSQGESLPERMTQQPVSSGQTRGLKALWM